MIDDTLLEAEEKMEKAVAVAKEDFATIRTGRAHPSMFNKITVEYYGTPDAGEPAGVVPHARAEDGSDPAVRQGLARRDRQGDPQQRPRREPQQRRRRSSASSSLSYPRSGARTTSRSPGTRPRTAGCRSGTSAGTPRTRSTSWSRAATRARTTGGEPRPSSRRSRTPTWSQVDELLKHKEAELLEV